MDYFPSPTNSLTAEHFVVACEAFHTEAGWSFDQEFKALLVAEALFRTTAPRFPEDTPVRAYFRAWDAAIEPLAEKARAKLRPLAAQEEAHAKILLRRIDHGDIRRGASDVQKYRDELTDRCARLESSPQAQAAVARRLQKLRNDLHALLRYERIPQEFFDAALPLREQRADESRDAYLDFLDVCARGHATAEASVAAARALPVAQQDAKTSSTRREYMAEYMRNYRAKKRRQPAPPPRKTLNEAIAEVERAYGVRLVEAPTAIDPLS